MKIEDIMEQGYLYTDYGDGKQHLEDQRLQCQELLYDYNATRPSEVPQRKELLGKLLKESGKGCWIEPPFKCAYGNRIHIKDYFYSNFNLVIVDDVDVYIGNYVMFAPNVCITTTGHPIAPSLRKKGIQFSSSVYIEDDVWVGSNSVILPGVRIGKGSVIGAGSVVTHDIPEGVVAYGSPCRVIRPITSQDDKMYFKDKEVAASPQWAYK
ncbi:sugar O-acetyltransferase [Amedibacillus sp. YH-ame10]